MVTAATVEPENAKKIRHPVHVPLLLDPLTPVVYMDLYSGRGRKIVRT
jgi:hypothetical protein